MNCRQRIADRLVTCFAAAVVSLFVTFLLVGTLLILLFTSQVEAVSMSGVVIVYYAFLASVVGAAFWTIVAWFSTRFHRSTRFLLAALCFYGLGIATLMAWLATTSSD